jgi:hypothetical protein
MLLTNLKLESKSGCGVQVCAGSKSNLLSFESDGLAHRESKVSLRKNQKERKVKSYICLHNVISDNPAYFNWNSSYTIVVSNFLCTGMFLYVLYSFLLISNKFCDFSFLHWPLFMGLQRCGRGGGGGGEGAVQ